MSRRAFSRAAVVAVFALMLPSLPAQSGSDRGAQQPLSAAVLSKALAELERARPDAQLHVRATAGVSFSGADVWVAGELARPSGRDAWSAGASADIQVSGATATGAARVTLARGERAFVSKVRLDGAPSGPLEIRVRLTPASADAAPLSANVSLDLSNGARPMLYRSGPSTANRVVPAADPRFSRTERIRLELALPAGLRAGSGRVLDAAGSVVALPVKVTESGDPATGEQWMLADLTLADLAPADYAIELVVQNGATEKRMLTPIRVVQ